ncbi:hypothetical protein GIB67_002645, partial [Kingdonia uniflora]
MSKEEEVLSRLSTNIGHLPGIIQAQIGLCDVQAKGNLCLYGFPTENWEVNSPAVKVPPELPEPALGINFARDGMPEKDWWSLVAVHSDAWLLAVAVYLAAKFEFDKNQRKSLLNMINELPTIFEVVNKQKKPGKEKSSVSNHSSTKSKPNAKGKSPRYRLPGSVGDVGSSGHEYDSGRFSGLISAGWGGKNFCLFAGITVIPREQHEVTLPSFQELIEEEQHEVALPSFQELIEEEQHEVALPSFQELVEKNRSLCLQIDDIKNDNEILQSRLSNANFEISEGEKLLKKLQYTIMELKGNIRVMCRVRPENLGIEKSVITYPASIERRTCGVDLVQR